jgi:hypothetical protein
MFATYKMPVLSKKPLQTSNYDIFCLCTNNGRFYRKWILLLCTDNMVFTDSTHKYFTLIPFKIRAAMARLHSSVPFAYDEEPFFSAYDSLYKIWVKRKSQRAVAASLHIGKDTVKNWEDSFVKYGALGLLAKLSYMDVDAQLEKLIILIKSSRPHESASLALRLSKALQIPGASLELIRKTQRYYGYGQRMNDKDVFYYQGLQHILTSILNHKKKGSLAHNKNNRAKTFYNFDHDPFQQRLELFKTLSQIQKKRQIRPILKRFGIHPNRYYILKDRYMLYGSNH